MLRDKKFLVLVGLIIFFPVFTVLLTTVLRGCQNRGSSYELYEKNMIKAAEKYIKKNKLEPSYEGEIAKVSLATLENNKYIKSSESSLKDSSCSGYVIARLNGSSLEKNKGGFINYLVNLSCKKYNTNLLINDLKDKSLNSDNTGLYKNGTEYIFKGNNVKNYITFYNKAYRIVGVTSDGLIKLVRSEYENLSRMWDNKYNIEVKQSYGKNIYSDSLIFSYLEKDYLNDKKISKDARKHIVANNTCIGKRAKSNVSISKQVDCQEVITNQLVSLMNVSDYALASTDPDCNSVVAKSCNNYNYLRDVVSSTWTPNAVLDNSYEVYTISGGVITARQANTYIYYNLVIYIDGNEKISSGDGTLEDPYVIK